MIKQILIKNGFTEKEALIYLCVLEAGEITISRIASKINIKRTTVYTTIDNLKTKGVVSINKRKGIQQVSALSPRVLVDRFLKAANQAENILPELIDMAYTSPFKPRIKFFEGLSGIKESLRKSSYSEEPSMGFTDYEPMPKELLKFIQNQIVPERKRRKNRAKLIVPDNETNRKIQAQDPHSFTEHRLITFETPENPIELLLYGKSQLMFLSFTRNEMFALNIDSPGIYKTVKNIFTFIWNSTDQNEKFLKLH